MLVLRLGCRLFSRTRHLMCAAVLLECQSAWFFFAVSSRPITQAGARVFNTAPRFFKKNQGKASSSSTTFPKRSPLCLFAIQLHCVHAPTVYHRSEPRVSAHKHTDSNVCKAQIRTFGDFYVTQPLPRVAPALYQRCTSVAPALYQRCTSVVPALYQRCTSVVPALY